MVFLSFINYNFVGTIGEGTGLESMTSKSIALDAQTSSMIVSACFFGVLTKFKPKMFNQKGRTKN